jgi:hypothetical protein
MSVSPEDRAAVRTYYDGRCGYCGVPETAVGNELEVDHFRPTSRGGGDERANLVYCCTACNRFKSDYWAGDEVAEELRLLHPGQDDLTLHIVETVSGRFVGLTPRGWFHIRWLHLNRPLLITFRQLRQRAQLRDEALTQAQEIAANLQRRVAALEQELAALRGQIARLSEQAEQ